MQRFQVSLLGLNSLFGRTSSLLLKQSPAIKSLKLYDEKDVTAAEDLKMVPTSCEVKAFSGKNTLPEALEGADIILIGDDNLSTPQVAFDLMAPKMYDYAKAIAASSPNALIIVAASPMNMLVPLLSEVLLENGCYNCNKVFGASAIDNTTASTLYSNYLRLDPRRVLLPVIGGSSHDTRVPLFSQAKPQLDIPQDAMKGLVKEIKRSENFIHEVKKSPQALNKAHSLMKFLNAVISGLRGDHNVITMAFSRTPLIKGIEYFSLPVHLGKFGIQQRYGIPKLLPLEKDLVEEAIESLNKDISQAKTFYKGKENAIEASKSNLIKRFSKSKEFENLVNHIKLKRIEEIRMKEREKEQSMKEEHNKNDSQKVPVNLCKPQSQFSQWSTPFDIKSFYLKNSDIKFTARPQLNNIKNQINVIPKNFLPFEETNIDVQKPMNFENASPTTCSPLNIPPKPIEPLPNYNTFVSLVERIVKKTTEKIINEKKSQKNNYAGNNRAYYNYTDDHKVDKIPSHGVENILLKNSDKNNVSTEKHVVPKFVEKVVERMCEPAKGDIYKSNRSVYFNDSNRCYRKYKQNRLNAQKVEIQQHIGENNKAFEDKNRSVKKIYRYTNSIDTSINDSIKQTGNLSCLYRNDKNTLKKKTIIETSEQAQNKVSFKHPITQNQLKTTTNNLQIASQTDIEGNGPNINNANERTHANSPLQVSGPSRNKSPSGLKMSLPKWSDQQNKVKNLTISSAPPDRVQTKSSLYSNGVSKNISEVAPLSKINLDINNADIECVSAQDLTKSVHDDRNQNSLSLNKGSHNINRKSYSEYYFKTMQNNFQKTIEDIGRKTVEVNNKRKFEKEPQPYGTCSQMSNQKKIVKEEINNKDIPQNTRNDEKSSTETIKEPNDFKKNVIDQVINNTSLMKEDEGSSKFSLENIKPKVNNKDPSSINFENKIIHTTYKCNEPNISHQKTNELFNIPKSEKQLNIVNKAVQMSNKAVQVKVPVSSVSTTCNISEKATETKIEPLPVENKDVDHLIQVLDSQIFQLEKSEKSNELASLFQETKPNVNMEANSLPLNNVNPLQITIPLSSKTTLSEMKESEENDSLPKQNNEISTNSINSKVSEKNIEMREIGHNNTNKYNDAEKLLLKISNTDNIQLPELDARLTLQKNTVKDVNPHTLSKIKEEIMKIKITSKSPVQENMTTKGKFMNTSFLNQQAHFINTEKQKTLQKMKPIKNKLKNSKEKTTKTLNKLGKLGVKNPSTIKKVVDKPDDVIERGNNLVFTQKTGNRVTTFTLQKGLLPRVKNTNKSKEIKTNTKINYSIIDAGKLPIKKQNTFNAGMTGGGKYKTMDENIQSRERLLKDESNSQNSPILFSHNSICRRIQPRHTMKYFLKKHQNVKSNAKKSDSGEKVKVQYLRNYSIMSNITKINSKGKSKCSPLGRHEQFSTSAQVKSSSRSCVEKRLSASVKLPKYTFSTSSNQKKHKIITQLVQNKPKKTPTILKVLENDLVKRSTSDKVCVKLKLASQKRVKLPVLKVEKPDEKSANPSYSILMTPLQYLEHKTKIKQTFEERCKTLYKAKIETKHGIPYHFKCSNHTHHNGVISENLTFPYSKYSSHLPNKLTYLLKNQSSDKHQTDRDNTNTLSTQSTDSMIIGAGTCSAHLKQRLKKGDCHIAGITQGLLENRCPQSCVPFSTMSHVNQFIKESVPIEGTHKDFPSIRNLHQQLFFNLSK